MELLYQNTQRNRVNSAIYAYTKGLACGYQGKGRNNTVNGAASYYDLLSESQQAVNDKAFINQEDIIKRYKKHKSTEDKTALIEKYSYLVSYCVRRMSMFLPSHIEVDDLMSEGVIGLIDAIEKFREEKGSVFRGA